MADATSLTPPIPGLALLCSQVSVEPRLSMWKYPYIGMFPHLKKYSKTKPKLKCGNIHI